MTCCDLHGRTCEPFSELCCEGCTEAVNAPGVAATILQGAADYIRQHGWQVDGMGAHNGPRCSMGAIQSAWIGGAEGRPAQIMYDALRTELSPLTLTEFNHKYRDGESVALLFERVADRLSR